MTAKNKRKITLPKGKLGVLLPGMGAVATTFIAGVLAVQKKSGLPIGSLTQIGRIRLGKRTEKRLPLIKDFVPLANLSDLVFAGWDPIPDNAYVAAIKAQVLKASDLEPLKTELQNIKPMSAVFDPYFVKRIRGTNIKKGANKLELSNALRVDIKKFFQENKLNRAVMIWCGSTEVYTKKLSVHKNLRSFERGLATNNAHISPSMIYAYAALKEGVPFINASPNSTDIGALIELAKKNKVPIAGKDLKTGQTLVKTIIAPGIASRLLGINGWFSTNILGNRDGEVLDEPGSFQAKEVTKSGVLDTIFDKKLYPKLYKNIFHKIRIEYYPPRGDEKEGWDNIDLFGWLGYPMQIKINFLCRDSILAAPLVLDLVLFADLAARAGLSGVQEWLSFYFKSPMHAKNLNPEHALFIQFEKLENTLRWLRGEKLIHHLGQIYYGEKE